MTCFILAVAIALGFAPTKAGCNGGWPEVADTSTCECA